MRLHDETNNKRLDQVGLVLTEKEARKLVKELEELLRDPEGEHELFMQSDDSGEELTASIVTDAKLRKASERGPKVQAWMKLLDLKPKRARG